MAHAFILLWQTIHVWNNAKIDHTVGFCGVNATDNFVDGWPAYGQYSRPGLVVYSPPSRLDDAPCTPVFASPSDLVFCTSCASRRLNEAISTEHPLETIPTTGLKGVGEHPPLQINLVKVFLPSNKVNYFAGSCSLSELANLFFLPHLVKRRDNNLRPS